MFVKIIPNDKGNPPGKLAEAELHFTDGPLEGLRLIGFAIWERRTAGGRNVTFPARVYSVNGERRSFALLRPIDDGTAQDRIREFVLQAYAEYEANAQDVCTECGMIMPATAISLVNEAHDLSCSLHPSNVQG